MVILPVYGDIKLCYWTSGIAFLSNILWIIGMTVKGRMDKDAIVESEIQVALIILVSLFLIICSKALRKISQNRIEEIDAEKKNTEKILSNTLDISGRMADYVKKIVRDERGIIADCSHDSNVNGRSKFRFNGNG